SSRSSSGVNTLSGSFPKSHSSQYSELGVTRTPLSVDHSPDSGLVSTPLPSSRFQFVPWHRLEQCEVTGDQLTCPRVREEQGPSEEEFHFREGRNFCLQENWENCLELNLSYQNLGDPYQRENFFRILRRLIRVEILQLIDNSLTDLSSVRLPSPSRCKMLNLHRNQLVCLRQLPKLPAVEHLCLSENAISSLRGLGALGSSPLRSLNLTRNPVTFSRDYRAQLSKRKALINLSSVF
uniref:U2A'/phosphoprotein 32 family A C-terminal domain-containing protein n=1 Tax=Poecilia formosa TaxID=48698 RepID=A0A096LX62_POEFO